MNDDFKSIVKAFLNLLPKSTFQKLKETKDYDSLIIQSKLWDVFTILFSDEKEIKTTEATSKIELDKSSSMLMFIRDTEINKWDLAIIINEATSQEDIRKSWSEINTFRSALIKLQGPEEGGSLNYYSKRKRQGASYSQIAQEVNQECLLSLAIATLEKDNPQELIYHIMAGLTLHDFGMKFNDSSEWCDDGFRQINEGHLPWSPKEGPIDWMRVRDTLRAWEKRKSLKEIDEEKIPTWQPFSLSENDLPVVHQALSLLKGLEKTG